MEKDWPDIDSLNDLDDDELIELMAEFCTCGKGAELLAKYDGKEYQIEYDLYDEVTPILFPLIDSESIDLAFSEMDDGGYPAGAVSMAFYSLKVPVPRSAIKIAEKYQAGLDAYNNDWFGVNRSMRYVIRENGIDEGA